MPSVSSLVSQLIKITAILTLLVSICYIGYVPSQSDFIHILIPYGFAFGAYWLLLKRLKHVMTIMILAISLRVVLVFAFPNLSDDIYRFAWDGNLSHQGINPYIHLPSDLINQELTSAADQLIFAKMNSKAYYTVYPPVSQLVFIASTILQNSDMTMVSIIMKTILLLGETISLFIILALLRQSAFANHNLSIYALNPLVIIEVMGNVHYEGLMVMFFLLGWIFLSRGKILSAAIPLALSVATKLFPLMLFPFVISYIGLKRAIVLFAGVGVLLLMMFYPIIRHLEFFLQSVDLYFQKFEFNASVYYMMRWLGFQISGYNQIAVIGPFLAMTTFGSIMYLWYKYTQGPKENIATYWLFSFTIYLVLATTVHPWYLIFPIALCTFTRFSYPMIWSGLISLSYISYAYEPFHENLWIVAFEYMVLFMILFVQILDMQQDTLDSPSPNVIS